MPYKLILADDELPIRQALAELYDWQGHDVEVAAVCRNGLEALEAILDESPDIVLTDIRMPGLSGLELIHRLRGVDHEAEYIILSGYRDFSYAQQAMAEGVTHYLTKPLDEDALWQAVEACKQARSAARSQQAHAPQPTRTPFSPAEQNLALTLTPGMTAATFADAVSGNAAPPEFGYALMDATLCADEGAPLLLPRVTALLKGLDAQALTPLLLIRRHGFLLLKLPHAELTQSVWEPFVQPLLSGRRQLLSAAQCLRNDNLLPCAAPLFDALAQAVSAEVLAPGFPPRRIALHTSVQPMAEDAYRALTQSTEEQARAVLDGFLAKAGSGEKQPSACAMLLTLLLNNRRIAPGDAGELFVTACRVGSTTEAATVFEDSLIAALFAGQTSTSAPVAQVQRYVMEHLSDSALSLRQIAREVSFMNVDYLSHLFAEETGVKFSAYLNGLRVTRGKELLLRGGMSVSEIAERVGCGDNPRYFSQVFKKYTGMTPTAFLECAKNEQ